MEEQAWLSRRFEENRPRLRGVAYRMLGSLAEAEDAVQEAWLRLERSDVANVENLGSWLTTVVSRVCLDVLRSRRARREETLGARGEPGAVRAEGADPEDEERELRTTLRAVREALATEGWFQPRLKVQEQAAAPPLFALEVELGPRTHVSEVDLKFSGAIAAASYAERRRQLEASWSLPQGQPFESAAWTAACS